MKAIDLAVAAFPQVRATPAYTRRRWLLGMRARLEAEKESFARLMVEEAGKPIRDARAELGRALLTLEIAAEEAGRIGGEVLPMDLTEAGEGRLALVRRFPIGPIGAITPFNFPVNLVLHKVAPALASGNTIVVKPSPRTPRCAEELARIAAESGVPEGAFTVLRGSVEEAQAIADDPRLKMLTFTGSAAAGWALKARPGAVKKRVTLELGGNAGAILHSDADLDYAVKRVLIGGFSFAGQSCIAVQRVLIERAVFDRFVAMLVPAVQALRVGDPAEETTDLGPMIDLAAAERAEAWIQEAAAGGATVLAGGTRQGRLLAPTILGNTTPAMHVNCEEIFAPVVTVSPYEDFDAALEEVNRSRYGLQAGVFTRDIGRIFRAFERLQVGGVMVNDIPTYRMDHMPYGGVKDSGFGREGIRYAIEEMTEPRIMVMNLR